MVTEFISGLTHHHITSSYNSAIIYQLLYYTDIEILVIKVAEVISLKGRISFSYYFPAFVRKIRSFQMTQESILLSSSIYENSGIKADFFLLSDLEVK